VSTPKEIEKMIEESRERGDFDKDWEETEVQTDLDDE
jgi:hypothetical protein